jgi:hypothetical protein
MMKILLMSTEYGEEETLLSESHFNDSDLKNEVVELNELLKALSDNISSSIASESKLIIELMGDVRMKGGAEVGAKVLCLNLFNLSGEIEKKNSMKITLETSLLPINNKD